jgi:hypothetical protein
MLVLLIVGKMFRVHNLKYSDIYSNFNENLSVQSEVTDKHRYVDTVSTPLLCTIRKVISELPVRGLS